MCETVTLYKNGNPLQCKAEDAAHFRALGWMREEMPADVDTENVADNASANSAPAKRAYNRKVQQVQ